MKFPGGMWTSLIAGYVNNDCASEAIRVFKDMESLNVEPNEITLVHSLVVCARSRDLGAKSGNEYLKMKMNICKDVVIGTALVDMHAKSGEAESARKVFSELKRKDTMAWTSMIIGLAMHGHGEEALSTFKRMQEDASVSPDQITYIGVLCACSHVGLVEEGQRHFTDMRNVYGSTYIQALRMMRNEEEHKTRALRILYELESVNCFHQPESKLSSSTN
ncbi:hypothetical protein QYF36_004749 [Acer negundo]|nr:hypothetical protein QYF36_004749 [Acer negundo]